MLVAPPPTRQTQGCIRKFLKGGRNFKPRQLKHLVGQAFSLVSAYAGLRLPTCAFCHISPFNTLIFFILVYRPSVVFCVCSVLQFNATLYLSRTPIVHITKNLKTKHIHTSNQLHPYSSLPLKKSTGTTSTSLINLYSGILC